VNDADREGFEQLIATRSQALLRSAYLMTGDAHLAEDLLQTALAKMIPRWSRLRDPGAAEAYLRRVMTTTYLKWWRRRWRNEVPSETLPDAPLGDVYADVDVRDALRRALATLTARQRAIVVLRFYEDLSEERVAELLGCSPGTVKSTSSRALAKLRDQGLRAEPEASAS
jgi:RNA polymerase sigma-70 factor (sigma-E family)